MPRLEVEVRLTSGALEGEERRRKLPEGCHLQVEDLDGVDARAVVAVQVATRRRERLPEPLDAAPARLGLASTPSQGTVAGEPTPIPAPAKHAPTERGELTREFGGAGHVAERAHRAASLRRRSRRVGARRRVGRYGGVLGVLEREIGRRARGERREVGGVA